jgi:MFS transporter, UMF1 family
MPASADDPAGKLPVGAVAWAFFEGARNPYVTLVTIYTFAPYAAAVIFGHGHVNPSIVGQEILSQWNTYSSLIIMLTAPFLGASIDKLGRRKTWLGLVVGLMVSATFALWWAKPDLTGLGVVGTLVLLSVMNVLFPWSEVLHNSLLVRAAGLGKAHKASGLALALGNAFTVVALAFTTWAFALPGKVPWSWVPQAPLFGLDPAQHQTERIVAPMAAVIFALGALPLFFLTPDVPPTGMPVIKAFREGGAALCGW